MVIDDEILARILYKLLNNKCFSKGHMLEERIISSVPKHERGRAKDILKNAVRKRLGPDLRQNQLWPSVSAQYREIR